MTPTNPAGATARPRKVDVRRSTSAEEGAGWLVFVNGRDLGVNFLSRQAANDAAKSIKATLAEVAR